jgi:hypothetical protein
LPILDPFHIAMISESAKQYQRKLCNIYLRFTVINILMLCRLKIKTTAVREFSKGCTK